MNGNGGRTHGRRPAERDRLLRREIRFVDSIIGGVARLDGEKVLCESAINFVGAISQKHANNNCDVGDLASDGARVIRPPPPQISAALLYIKKKQEEVRSRVVYLRNDPCQDKNRTRRKRHQR